MASTVRSDIAGVQRGHVSHLEHVMGTVVTIDVYGDAASDPWVQIDEACASLHAADEMFSTWKPDSPMSRLRRNEIAIDRAPAELIKVLRSCEIARTISGGWFDPWKMPGGIDPTGYVKGWAAQRALASFESGGPYGAIVNAAGDIASFGKLDPETPFRIGIVDPFAPGRLACVVELVGAIATSGTYERGSHLINPITRRPTARAASASVTGPDLGLADALATGLAVGGDQAFVFVEAVDGYEALVIGLDGGWRWTPGFPFTSRNHIPPS